MSKCMLIDDNGDSRIVEATEVSEMNALIGSDSFDGIRLPDGAVIYVDDVGLFKELPANMVASILATETRKLPTILVGKALVCGVDENGNQSDVPDWVLKWKFQLDMDTSIAENN